MIKLHGSPISNYYNKVKMALLEKGIAFEEVYSATKSKDEAVLAISPLGKIPFLGTDEGGLCESQVILEYLEAKFPAPALLPQDPYEAARVRQLCTFIDWHVEMTARQLYPAAFFGAAPLAGSEAARIRKELEARIAALKRFAKFSPYIAGDTFTLTDCCAFGSFPVVGLATRQVYGEDLLAAGLDSKPYMKFIGERASAQKVVADRKAAQAR